MCVKVKFDTEIQVRVARSGEGVSWFKCAVSFFCSQAKRRMDEEADFSKDAWQNKDALVQMVYNDITPMQNELHAFRFVFMV